MDDRSKTPFNQDLFGAEEPSAQEWQAAFVALCPPSSERREWSTWMSRDEWEMLEHLLEEHGLSREEALRALVETLS